MKRTVFIWSWTSGKESHDITCQLRKTQKIPPWTLCIYQWQAAFRAPPSTLSVKSCILNKACCWGWQTTAGGKRQKREGMKRERSRVGGGSQCYSSESSEARQIQWRNPPSSQMNITTSLLLLLLSPSTFFFFFSPPPPCFFSIIHQCAQSPQHTAPAAAAPADPPSLLDLLLT